MDGGGSKYFSFNRLTTGTLEKDTHPCRQVKKRRRPGRDCRDPESMDGGRRHVPVIWIPAIPAGMTLDLILHFFV